MTKQIQEKYTCSDLNKFNDLKDYSTENGYVNHTSLASNPAATLLTVLLQCGLELPAADPMPAGRVPRSVNFNDQLECESHIRNIVGFFIALLSKSEASN